MLLSNLSIIIIYPLVQVFDKSVDSHTNIQFRSIMAMLSREVLYAVSTRGTCYLAILSPKGKPSNLQ